MSGKTLGGNRMGNETGTDKLHDFYFSPNVFRFIKSRKMSGKNMFHSLERSACMFMLGSLVAKRPHGRLGRRWEYNIMTN
jgi:hypothetical protein